MFENFKNDLKAWWESVKAWFKHSETIFLARAEVFVGLVIATVSAVDWSPLWDIAGVGTAFNWTQGVTIGGILFVKGLFAEWARRRNSTL